MTGLMAQRKAANVLPLPVGARINVESPRAMAGQPSRCGGVGASKEARNQSATAPWKISNTPPRFATFLLSLDSFLLPSSVFRPVSLRDGRFGRGTRRRRSEDRGADGRA